MPSDPTRRDVLARARDVRSELESSPTVRGLLAGTVSAGIAKGAGGSWRGAVGLGVVIGARRRALMAAEQRVLRELRNAADAATLAAWLGELTPPLGTWAIEPDFARLVAAELARAPETVVECGSGTTTLLIGKLLKQNAHGRLVSLEHDRAFADRTRSVVRRAHLEDVCEVVWAPLRRQLVRGETVTWYDPDRVGALSNSIDLLVVDGPPSVVPWARWPALAVLAGALPSGGTVLLDDGRRTDERRTACRWRAEYPEFELYWHDTVKGSWRLVKADRPSKRGATVSAYQRVRRLLNPYPTGLGRWPVQR